MRTALKWSRDGQQTGVNPKFGLPPNAHPARSVVRARSIYKSSYLPLSLLQPYTMSTSAMPKIYDASPPELEANEKEVPQEEVKNVFGQDDEVEGVAHAATSRGLLPHHIQLIGG